MKGANQECYLRQKDFNGDYLFAFVSETELGWIDPSTFIVFKADLLFPLWLEPDSARCCFGCSVFVGFGPQQALQWVSPRRKRN
jgi:hypothetical protein